MAWSSSLLPCVKRDGEKYIQGSFHVDCPQDEQEQLQDEQPEPRAEHETRYRHVQSHRFYKAIREDDIPPSETKIPKKEKDFFHQA